MHVSFISRTINPYTGNGEGINYPQHGLGKTRILPNKSFSIMSESMVTLPILPDARRHGRKYVGVAIGISIVTAGFRHSVLFMDSATILAAVLNSGSVP